MIVRLLSAATAVLAFCVSAPALAAPQFPGDTRLYEIAQPDGFIRAVPTVDTAQTGSGFYDFRSASSHTGYEAAGLSLLMLHRDTRDDALTLVMTHGIDDLGQPAEERQPANSRVFMDLSGVPAGASVAVADDNAGEFSLGQEPEGDWSFVNNTDGAAIAGIPNDAAWSITFDPTFQSGIDTWAFQYDAGALPLDDTLTATLSSRLQTQGPAAVAGDEGADITVCAFATETDPAVASLDYVFDWGDETTAETSARPGVEVCATRSWADDGVYEV